MAGARKAQWVFVVGDLSSVRSEISRLEEYARNHISKKAKNESRPKYGNEVRKLVRKVVSI